MSKFFVRQMPTAPFTRKEFCKRFILIGTFLLASLVCAIDEPKAVELIRDRFFRRGFNVLAPQEGKRVAEGMLRLTSTAQLPIWDIAQWNSKFSIANAEPFLHANGDISFSNAAKYIRVSTNGLIVLGAKASFEYGTRARRKGEPWPHLLIAQKFQTRPAVAELKHAVLHVAVRLPKAAAWPTLEHTPKLHAAQFQLFITVQNLNRKSAGYGDFFYFGVPLYDNRQRIPGRYAAADRWGKFIYIPPGDTYTTQSAHDGEWVVINKDLLSLILEGLRTAWNNGYLQDSRDLLDYTLGGINLGWELPGTFDVEMEVRELSLKGTTK